MFSLALFVQGTSVIATKSKYKCQYPTFFNIFSVCYPNPGSTLGPLLFVIYVNNTPKLNGMTIMYAYDTSVINVWVNLEELEISTATVNTGKDNWYVERNNLFTNLLKSKFLLFQTQQNKISPT
jgi:hypothetical protein